MRRRRRIWEQCNPACRFHHPLCLARLHAQPVKHPGPLAMRCALAGHHQVTASTQEGFAAPAQLAADRRLIVVRVPGQPVAELLNQRVLARAQLFQLLGVSLRRLADEIGADFLGGCHRLAAARLHVCHLMPRLGQLGLRE